VIIHLATSKHVLVHYIDTLRSITATISGRGHALAEDWIEPAYTKALHNISPDLKKTYHQSMREVGKADVIIAEVTTSSFGVGYQVAIAIQQRKPVLLLARKGAPVNALVKGLDNKVVLYREYTDEDLEQIVTEFLDENDVKTQDLRFNFFIDRKIYNYLRWTSQKTGKTKAQVLRDLIAKEIE
jgi:nucleoside 2-deoxyribosyltransferase